MITIRRSQHDPKKNPWWWIGGDTKAHKELFKEYGARWSRKRKQWYLIAESLPQAIQDLADSLNREAQSPSETKSIEHEDVDAHDPCSIEEASKILGIPLREKTKPIASPKIDIKQALETDVEDEKEIPAIRILDAPQDEAFKESLRQLRNNPPALPSNATSARSGRMTLIPQAYCGELTGSITGQVWSYGWAVHEGVCIYLNMAGPKIATEAIRSKLAQGAIVNLLPDDSVAIELTAGEGNSAMYTDFLQYISSAKFASRILIHESMMEANYGGKSTTYIIHISSEQAMAQVKHHVSELVNIAVFDDWSSYLWQAGSVSKLIRETRSGGGITIYAIDLDVDAWSRLISGGLSEKLIELPRKVV